MKGRKLTLTATALLKERLADLADRTAWLGASQAGKYLIDRIQQCQEQLG